MSISSVTKFDEKENCLIVNIEANTTVTTIIDQNIYDINKIDVGSQEILDKINLKENSYQKAYEMCKETTIYTSEGRELTEQQAGYLEEIMPTLYQIVGQIQKTINESFEKIEKIYGIKKENIVSFAANVNPLGESGKLKTALSERIDAITKYPDREYTSLRKAIGSYCKCDYNHITVGNGCTELISLFIQITAPKKTLLLGPTYSEYERDLRINGSDISYYFLKEKDDFKIDSDEFISAITADTDLVIICNPNNPTGSLITPDKLKTILTHCKDTNTYVMIDETYIEFVPDVDELSAIPLTELFDNVIILRGTSKFFATPGLRLGYAITSNSQILTDINTNKNPWMINSLAVVAGETMFLDEEYIDKTRSLILSEKTRCRQLIEESHKFKLYPSYSNFYLLKILDEGVDAHMLFERAIRQGMMIRDCSTFPGLEERFIRFCIMKPEDNTRLINCLTQ